MQFLYVSKGFSIQMLVQAFPCSGGFGGVKSAPRTQTQADEQGCPEPAPHLGLFPLHTAIHTRGFSFRELHLCWTGEPFGTTGSTLSGKDHLEVYHHASNDMLHLVQQTQVPRRSGQQVCQSDRPKHSLALEALKVTRPLKPPMANGQARSLQGKPPGTSRKA